MLQVQKKRTFGLFCQGRFFDVEYIVLIWALLSLIVRYFLKKGLDSRITTCYIYDISGCYYQKGVFMSTELLTVSQIAKYLQLSEKTIRRLISEKRLPASKVANRTWRMRASDVDGYIQAHTNGKKENSNERGTYSA
jgi:excisionase family DNA binding protein